MLFYLKKPKNYVGGPVPIYMRITVDRIPKEISIGRSVDPSRWRPKANRAAGTKEEIRTLNSYLETLVRNIEDVHTALVKENAVITAESLNVPIETVSKMLGHTNIKTTQHYAKLLNTRVANDMQIYSVSCQEIKLLILNICLGIY